MQASTVIAGFAVIWIAMQQLNPTFGVLIVTGTLMVLLGLSLPWILRTRNRRILFGLAVVAYVSAATTFTIKTASIKPPIRMFGFQLHELVVGQPLTATAYYTFTEPVNVSAGAVFISVVNERLDTSKDWRHAINKEWERAESLWEKEQDVWTTATELEGKMMISARTFVPVAPEWIDDLRAGRSFVFFAGRRTFKEPSSMTFEFCVVFNLGNRTMCQEHNGVSRR